MQNQKTHPLLAVLLILASLLTSCSVSTPSQEASFALTGSRILKIHLSQAISSIDPSEAQNAGEILLARLAFEGLVKESYGQIIPNLASEWEVSNGGKTYTFYLEQDVYFHNGQKLTALDCKYSWERVARRSSNSYLFSNVQGAQEVSSGQEREMSGLIVVDENTLIVNLIQPQDNFLQYLATPAASILNRLELIERGSNYALAGSYFTAQPPPSGTGPFVISEWLDSGLVSLGANSQYRREEPRLDRIEFSYGGLTSDAMVAFFSGKMDIVENAFPWDFPLVLGDNEVNMLTTPVRDFFYLSINPNIPPFDNLYLRQALQESISASSILVATRGNYGICPYEGASDYWNSLADIVSAEKAGRSPESLLRASGLSYDLPSLVLYCSVGTEEQKAARSILAAWSKLGFSTELRVLSTKDFYRRALGGELDMYLGEFVDKGGGLEIFFREATDNLALGGQSWPSTLKEAYQAIGEEKQTLFSQAEKELLSDGVIQILYFKKCATAVTDEWQELKLDQGGIYQLEQLESTRDR